MKNQNIKRLYFDIETSPNIGFFWNAGYKQSNPYSHIIKERAIICICYKWSHEKTVGALTWDKDQDDKSMLEKFLKILNTADEIITQNGDKFDMPWLRTRCLYHGIPMFPKYNTLDTFKKAKSGFRFNSNALDYMGSFLKLGTKDKMSFEDWKKIMLNKDKSSLDKMVKYCKQDVLLLEKVYNKMANYITHNVHHGVIKGNDKCSCPECGSSDTKLSKTRVNATGSKVYQLQCSKCGKYHSVSETTYNKK